MSQSPHADPLPALVQDADRLRELNQRVHGEVMRKLVFSQEEMEREAVSIWRVQPSCRAFLMGFTAYEHRIVGGPWRFEQQMPRYSSDWSAIRLVEDEIAKRGLGKQYVRALGNILAENEHRYDCWEWNLMRASCEQRCKAALSVCGALHDRRTDA